jgi:hypothetical protein
MLEAGYAAPELAGRANKLAELIVNECAEIAHKSGIVSNKSEAARVEAWRIYYKIQEHFGVEL